VNLLDLPRRELARLLREGHPIKPTALDDKQYKGISLGLPAWVDRLAWKTFVKTFHRDPDTGLLRGWNIRLEQDGVDAPVRPMTTRSGDPKSFGHFKVVEYDGPGLLIKYNFSPLRDPIVALRPGDPTLLLGVSYLRLGIKVPTPSYFSLHLDGPLAFIPGS
jgi:hypothetical protein